MQLKLKDQFIKKMHIIKSKSTFYKPRDAVSNETFPIYFLTNKYTALHEIVTQNTHWCNTVNNNNICLHNIQTVPSFQKFPPIVLRLSRRISRRQKTRQYRYPQT